MSQLSLAQALERIAELESENAQLKDDLALAFDPNPAHLTLVCPIPMKEHATPYETWLLSILHRRLGSWVASVSINAMFAELAETLGKPIPCKKLLTVRIHHLRRKITYAHAIEGKWGVGYRLVEHAAL